MDQLIGETVKGITETITEPSLINIDYADVRAIMSKGGVATMLVGESKQQNKAESVVRECLSNPMLDIDYRGATGALIHITGGSDLTLIESEEIASSLTYELDAHADVIWGARIRNDMEGKVRVLAIMTGVKNGDAIAQPKHPYRVRAEEIDQKLRSPKTPDVSRIKRIPVTCDFASGHNIDWFS
jgi:cell division protein FtsZ